MIKGQENLIPITSETAKELGAKGGKAKKGSRHLSTIIKEILSNVQWEKTTLKNKDELNKLYGKNGWDAIVYVATTKAMAGDAQAWKWLSENSFGTKHSVDHTILEAPKPLEDLAKKAK